LKNILVVITLAHLKLKGDENGIVTDAFSLPVPTQYQRTRSAYSLVVKSDNLPSLSTTTTMTAKYGPSSETSDEEQAEWQQGEEKRTARQTEEFKALLSEMTDPTSTSNTPENLPGLMTRNVGLLLNMRGHEGSELMKEAIEEAEATGDEETVKRVIGAADYMTSFVEEFVNQAKTIDDGYKQLMGKIIRRIAGSGEGKRDGDSTRDAEIAFDQLMKTEKQNFTPGFIRHLEGECQRIASARNMTPESSKMLQTIRLIQTRVLEELGQDLGEGALVLSQLLGYDDRNERMAVLDAGLTVRGVDFAKELAALTTEALDGFKRVPGGVDPNLVQIINEVDERIQSYIQNSDDGEFQ